MADPVSSTHYPSYLLNGKPLKRNQEAFRPFLHYVSPDPVPSRTQFYLENLTNNAAKSYEDGMSRYFRDLKTSPARGLTISALTLGLGLAFTAFQKHATLIKIGFLMSFLGYPVMAAIRHVPKMIESYQTARQGEPTKAKAEFRKSRDEMFFQIFHNYLKPLSLAFSFYYILNFRGSPLIWTRQMVDKGIQKLGTNPLGIAGTLQGGLKKLGGALKAVSDSRPVLFLDNIAKGLERWGDRVVAPVSRWLPKID